MSAGLLPIFVSVEGARVVVTGHGPAAREIASRLRDLGARVLIVDPAPPSVAGCESAAASPSAAHLQGAMLLVTASDDPAADRAILAAACERALLTVPVSGAGAGAAPVAFLGACEERGSIAVAATTRGRSPGLERRLAASAADSAVEPHHERLAEILAGIRAKLEERIPDDATRDAIWEQILDSPVALLLQSGSDDEAIEMAERMAWGTG